MADEIKNIVEQAIENHEKDYPIKLTWKQLWAALAAITTVAGVIFGAGMKTQSGISNIELSKVKMQFQQDLAKLENEKIVLTKEKLIASEDADFYKNRYLVNQKRLDECIKKRDFVSSSEEEIIEKSK